MTATHHGLAARVLAALEMNAADHAARRAQQVISFQADDIIILARAVTRVAQAEAALDAYDNDENSNGSRYAGLFAEYRAAMDEIVDLAGIATTKENA